MIFGYFTLFVALLIEVVGAYYSITGLAAIFSGAVIPILIMGGVLEVGKVTAAVWLKNNWHRASMQFKLYLLPAVILLMFITSMGIFGFLSKAHNDQNLVSGDVLGKIAIYDEKIKIQRDNIESARRALQQMDAAVDQTMSRSTTEQGADKATAIRRSQARERTNLQNEIARAQTEIVKLNDQRAPIAAEVRKVEAEVGPIKYIAKLIYGDNPDANLLEQAVVWVIIMIVAVFDPLALVLILAAQQSIRWARGEDAEEPERKNILDSWSAFFKKPPITDFDPRPDQQTHIPVADYYAGTGIDIEEVNKKATEAAEADREPADEGTLVAVQDDVEDKPFKGRGVPPAMPLTASYQQAEVPEEPNPYQDVKPDAEHWYDTVDQTEKTPDPFMEDLIMAKESEPVIENAAVEPVVPAEPAVVVDIPNPRAAEASPGRNRGVMFTQPVQADNTPNLGRASNSDFGNQFPESPQKGDVYLRTDYLPNRLYKFNGKKWIEVDKTQTDVYAYNEMYIKYLIEQIDSGKYDIDTLSEVEREQISQYLNRNA
jgi:hypothetical protein